MCHHPRGFLMITTKDIAALAGVSQTAVSAVLSGQGRQRRISEETSRKIIDTARRLGYRRNLAAQELRRGKSSAVGILLPAPVNNIYSYLSACPFAGGTRVSLHFRFLGRFQRADQGDRKYFVPLSIGDHYRRATAYATRYKDSCCISDYG